MWYIGLQVDIVEYFVAPQVGLIGHLVVYQATSQRLSGTLEADAMYQAVRWNVMNKPDL
jgi:hypothetical protein